MTTNKQTANYHNHIQREYYESRNLRQNWRMLPDQTNYVMSHVQRLINDNGLLPSQRILDIGCGMGKFTIPLAAQELQMEGLDLSPYLLEQLQKTNNSGVVIKTHEADILDPPKVMKSQYDVVCGFFMLHHLSNLEEAFLGVKQLLKPGARIAFIDVNAYCPLYYLQVTFAPTMSWRAERGILNLTDKKLNSALTKAGFIDINIHNFGISPPPIKNSLIGDKVDRVYDRISMLKPFAAFKSISASLPG